MPGSSETPRRKVTGAVVPAVAAAVLAAGAALLAVSRFAPEEALPESCIMQNADAVGGPIELLDQNGGVVTQADFAGAPAVVYFGFANCPDICPTTMYELAEALREPNGYDVQAILITLDPERDTPQIMGQYAETDGFPLGLQGLSGSRAQIDAAKSAFHVYAARAPSEGAPEGVYNIDHSSFLYVMDEAWRTRAIVNTVEASPDEISRCIAAGLSGA
jgi:protein SCO1/2